jgi:MoxR-like ATPase
VRHVLPSPFFVLATQNPLEQEGTYPLPEAQLDRFMFQILIKYPTADEELEVMRRKSARASVEVAEVLHAVDIERVHRVVQAVPVAEHVMKYALRLVRATRVGEPDDEGSARPEAAARYLSWGAGPRASEFLVLGAKAKALLEGATHATPEHVRAVVHPVLRHRVLTNFNAEADQITPDDVIDALVEHVAVDGAPADRLDRVLK